MRQQNSNIKYETRKQRSQRIKRNRQIRKERLFQIGYSVSPFQESGFVFKQEKINPQKIKNRQAAQKSREQKKMHVNELEDQIRALKEKINMIRFCENCQKQLQIREQSNFSSANSTQEETGSILDSPQNSPLNEMPQQPEQLAFENESQFIRMSSNQEHSSIGIYLFIFMIVLGVFCFGTRIDSSEGPMRRDLTQFYNSEDLQASPSLSQDVLEGGKNFKFDINQSPTYSTRNVSELEKNNNGIISMNQLLTPKSISDEKCFEEIVASFENYKIDHFDENNLRSTSGYIESNKSLLFCSSPKIYHSSSSEKSGVLTAFIDIFVQGAEIINFLPQTIGETGGLHLEGLYKITASVEGIEQIPLNNLNSAYE